MTPEVRIRDLESDRRLTSVIHVSIKRINCLKEQKHTLLKNKRKSLQLMLRYIKDAYNRVMIEKEQAYLHLGSC